MKIHLVLPTLNERIGLENVFYSIPKEIFHKITVLDGNSSDGTQEWCLENKVDCWVQPRKGLRHGFNDFFNSIQEKPDYFLTFSPDGNCDTSTLIDFVSFLESNPETELIIGSRYLDGKSSQDDDFITGAGNKFFTNACNFLFNSHLTDVFSIYRAFKPEIIEKLFLNEDASYVFFESIFKTRLPWEPLMTFRSAKYKLKIAEFAVGEPARIGGERKLQVVRWGASFMGQLIRETWYSPRAASK